MNRFSREGDEGVCHGMQALRVRLKCGTLCDILIEKEGTGVGIGAAKGRR